MRGNFVNKNVEFIYAGNVVLSWLISDFSLHDKQMQASI